MSIHVDNAATHASGCPYARTLSRLWADTPAELDDIAARLGLDPVMRHDPGLAGELPAGPTTPAVAHYEITEPERRRAILFGATCVTAPTLLRSGHRGRHVKEAA